jgi:hypothetical protein
MLQKHRTIFAHTARGGSWPSFDGDRKEQCRNECGDHDFFFSGS